MRYRMECIENGIYKANYSSIDTQKFSNVFCPVGEKYSKRILTYSYCTKCNEINIHKKYN